MRTTIISDEHFLEMREIATKIWQGYSDEFGYVTEKLARINSFGNVQDNAMVFYRMFDWENQQTFKSMASDEVLQIIKENL